MGYEFNGVSKIIQLTAGTTRVDVRDLYSRWKDWVHAGNSQYLQAMYPVGGDPINAADGIYITTYIFLTNGWRVRPQEANHTLVVENGVLLTDVGQDPFLPTQGNYNVQIKYSQPIKTETVSIDGGEGGLTPEQHEQLMNALTTGKFLALK